MSASNGKPMMLSAPPELIEAIAQRAAEIVAQTLEPASRSPYMNVEEAAEYLRCKPQRVYDLVSMRRLTPRKDGSRSLFHRDDLDAVLEEPPR
jgi:excisionase family DNA binding protein